MATYDGLGSDPAANYGTDANYQANYRLTGAFVDGLRGAVPEQQPDLDRRVLAVPDRRLRLRRAADRGGHQYSVETPQHMSHRWDSGWMPLAMAALYQDSLNQ